MFYAQNVAAAVKMTASTDAWWTYLDFRTPLGHAYTLNSLCEESFDAREARSTRVKLLVYGSIREAVRNAYRDAN